MPSIYSKQLSFVNAATRSNQGLSRESEVRTNNSTHPSFGGSHGYPLWLREDILMYEQLYGIDYAAWKFSVSKQSIYRWKVRVEPLQQTGNKEKDVLTGIDQYLLITGLFLYPRLSDDKLALFIAINGGTAGLSRQAISERCKELTFSRKRASLEAYAAYTPFNRLRVFNFFNCPPRIGISTVPFFRMIDVDEAKFCLSGIEKSTGRALTCFHVRDTGHYSRMAPSLTLILAVEPGNPNLPPHMYGSIYNPRKWWKITCDNVNQIIFADFLEMVCSDIETNPVPGGYDLERIFLWDNLAAHETAIVNNTIEI